MDYLTESFPSGSGHRVVDFPLARHKLMHRFQVTPCLAYKKALFQVLIVI